MKQAKSFIAHGKVQGVGFRYFTQMTAADHHVTGWVKNLEDGSVKIHAEGTAEQLHLFAAALKQGNLFAKVYQLQEEPAPLEQTASFKIKY